MRFWSSQIATLLRTPGQPSSRALNTYTCFAMTLLSLAEDRRYASHTTERRHYEAVTTATGFADQLELLRSQPIGGDRPLRRGWLPTAAHLTRALSQPRLRRNRAVDRARATRRSPS